MALGLGLPWEALLLAGEMRRHEEPPSPLPITDLDFDLALPVALGSALVHPMPTLTALSLHSGVFRAILSTGRDLRRVPARIQDDFSVEDELPILALPFVRHIEVDDFHVGGEGGTGQQEQSQSGAGGSQPERGA